ncbi:hypothetical protein ACWD4G_39165 [Streptomyces sp. NPDC002643]
MKSMARKTLAVTALAGALALGVSGVAAAANKGDVVSASATHAQEGVAYDIALDTARGQCPKPNDISLVSRSTTQLANGQWRADISVRCN